LLYFVFGRAGSGKTTFLRNLIKDFVGSSDEIPILIVPEQYSFESERELLRILGPDKINRVENLSFSRLAHKVVSKYKKIKKPFITDAERSVIMSMCLNELSDTLEIYGKHTNSTEVLEQLINADIQMRQSCVLPQELSTASENTKNFILKQKMREIALISESYRAQISAKYEDESGELDELAHLIAENNLFEDRVIMLDSFRGFTRQEMKVFVELLKRAKAVYISICANDFSDAAEGFGAFTHTTEFAKKLRALAKENDVRIAKCAYLSSAAKFNNFPPGQTKPVRETISALEHSLYSPQFEGYSKETGDIVLVSARDKADESEFVAREIRRLTREEKIRCRDIYIIERTEGSYKPFLLNAIRRNGLPVFDDARRCVFNEPLFFSIYYAIESVVKGFSTQSIMRYLKTGLSDIELFEICLVDNYTVVWDIDGAAWKKEWKNHPSGLGYSLNQKAAENLKKINDIRSRILKPLLWLKEETADADGTAISKAVFDFVINTGMRERLLELALISESEGRAGEVAQKNELWNALVSILEQAVFLFGEKKLSLKRFCEIFKLLALKTTLGVIPQGIDEITIGAADRIRTEDARVVFIVGANDGIFPLDIRANGVFSEADRKELLSLGIEMSFPYEYMAAQERFITYCALTAARERLYVSYSKYSFSGENLKPSEIVTHLELYFKNCKKVSASGSSLLENIESGESALSVYAQNISNDSVFTASLRSSISHFDEYSPRLKALDKAASKGEIKIEDKKTALDLFGKNITLSASKLQSYFECPFSYFCKYGLSVKELRAASLDFAKSGSVIHFVLEGILKEMTKEELLSADETTLKNKIDELLNAYLEEMMGGKEGKSNRFLNLFYRLSRAVFAVISRLKNELKLGQFVPVEYELYIGGDEIPPLTIPLSDGSDVKVTGIVDRVDIMTSDDKKYLRIIDYKTGKKEFNLSDVIQGRDIQMCLYLLTIDKNGKEYFGNTIPAGVLYLPSKIGIKNMKYGRNPKDAEIERRKLESGKLSGMILDDACVIKGMGATELEGYFPVKYDKYGKLVGNLYNAQHLGKLSRKIEKIITDMGEALHSGEIPPYPFVDSNDYSACTYCDYKSVCGFETGDRVKNIEKLHHDKVLEMLEKEYTNE